MKKKLFVNDEYLNSKLHFLNHNLYYIYISFFFHRNQKIYVLYFASNFVISLKFYKNVILILGFILFYFVYINRLFTRWFNLHKLYNIIREF
jgi:hypothetical protein